MASVNKRINPYLAILLIFLAGLAFTLLIWASINQPSGLDIGSTSASVQQ
jgi:hypothetical protein